MKIAYVAQISAKSRGVLKKIHGQIAAWEAMGHEVRYFFISHEPVPGYTVYPFWKRYKILNPTFKLLCDLNKYQPDCIYMREDGLPVSRFIRFLLWGKKTILEINGNGDLEGKKYYYNSFPEKRNYWLNYAVNHFFYRFIAGIVCVSHELATLPHIAACKQTLVIPNSINFQDISIRKTNTSSSPIHVLFLGSQGQEWHGVDKIIHLAKQLDDKFIFHIVGPSPQDLQQYSPPQNVVIHGYKTHYEDIVKKCHIAIGSLALHRIDMDEASPLKVREYLASGFPVLIGYTDTAFIEETPDFVFRIENTEYPFKNKEILSQIEAFFQKNAPRIVSRGEVEQYIDADIYEKKRICFMKECLKK